MPVPPSAVSARTYNIREMATLLGVSVPTVRVMDRRGELPGRVRPNGHGRWKRAVVDAWLKGQEVGRRAW
jgi:excisionase family DNA binding protein